MFTWPLLPSIKLDSSDSTEVSPRIPVQDSPVTPATPDIQGDITLQSDQSSGSNLEATNTWDLATVLRDLYSEKDPWVTGVKVVVPESLDQAKGFLSKQRLPPRFPRRRLDLSTTPVTSKGGMICHGCHGQMGGGAHNGSAPGKGICTLPHSLACPGGIGEDQSWSACPQGYIAGLISNTGFEHTLQQSDFGPMHSSTVYGASQPSHPVGQVQSTPQLGGNPGVQPQTVPRQTDHQHGTGTPLSAPQPGSDRSQLGGQVPVVTPNPACAKTVLDPNNLPHHVPLDPQAVDSALLGQGQVGGQHSLRPRSGINYNEDSAVDLTTSSDRAHTVAAQLRANNQIQNQVEVQSKSQESGFPFTINDLRADPGRRKQVEFEIEKIRQDIPSLSAARSAPPMGDQPSQAARPQYSVQSVPVTGVKPLPTPPALPGPYTIRHGIQDPRQHPEPGYQQVNAQYYPGYGQAQQHSRPVLSNPHQLPTQPPYNGLPGQSLQNSVHQQHLVQPGPQGHQELNQHMQQLSLQSYPRGLQQQYVSPTSLHYPDLSSAPLYQGLQQPPVRQHQNLGPQQHPANQQHGLHQSPVPPSQNNIGVAQLRQNQCNFFQPGQSACQPHYQAVQQQGGLQQSLVHTQLPQQQPQPLNQGQYGGNLEYDEVYEYMTDQAGRRFLVKSAAIVKDTVSLTRCVPTQTPQHQPSLGQAAQPPLYSSTGYHRSDQQIPLQQSFTDQAGQSHQDRIQGMTILNDQRATKKLNFGEFLKRCPTKWARETNTRNMNLSIFGYASLAELEYSMMNSPDQVSQGELLAKINHLKSVFEVCCLNSKDSDFKSYGWVLARDYAAKVSNKVEQGYTTWERLPSGVQTAELVSAQCDYPRNTQKSDVKDKEREPDTRKKKLCTTYNTCTTEYKCDYEVTNPDKECQRLHECSWCRKNLKQGFKHQESRCKKKTE